jgi:hypothetical protein
MPDAAPSNASRRSVLKRGLLGGAILALGGGGLLAARRTRRVPLPSRPLSVLDEDQYAVMHAIAARIVNPAEGAPSIDQVAVAWNVDQILAAAGADVQGEVKQLLGLFESALFGFLFGARTAPFTQLSGDAQDEVLREWQDSRVSVRRTGYLALRQLALSGYYTSPVVWPVIGYPGPPAEFHDPSAKVWRGGGEPRPEGPGVYSSVEDE